MVVRTQTPRVDELRRNVMELYISAHPLDCLTCPANGDCELQDMAGVVGLREVRYGFAGENHLDAPTDSSNPYFDFDESKCIACSRCVRACDEIQGTLALTIVGRDPRPEIRALAERPGIVVTGEVRDPADYIAPAAICIDPVQAGAGMQNKLIEFMAVAKPVVATKISGSDELVRAGQTGTFFPVGDAARATEALLELVRDEAMRSRYSKSARQVACEGYSFAAMAQAHCRAYQLAIERRWNR